VKIFLASKGKQDKQIKQLDEGKQVVCASFFYFLINIGAFGCIKISLNA
jgi:hypothetical protein